MNVRTRFAPSPTGFLHIGGVRTALFNWLFARRHGGKYLLRIDDTDEERNVEAALAPILHGFRWLDLPWDEGPEVGGPHAPYFQSQRKARYQTAVEKLLASGNAYRDFARPEEIDAERKTAEAEKRAFQYSRRFMAKNADDEGRFAAEGRKGVVRLKMPRQGSLVIPDLVRGDVEFSWAQEQDHVIQRSDKSFIYHLANVVDDEDFGVTHVIRAEEHLSNTPRQLFMVRALGYKEPAYAHLPYVAEPGSKRKLSKRKLDQYLKNPDFKKVHDHGAQVAAAMKLATTPETFNPVVVDFYEQVGYLPDAIVNYLVLLGWSLDDKTEHFTRAEMIANFSLARVQKAPASFDPAKLQAIQLLYMQKLSLEEKVARTRPFVERAGFSLDDARLSRIIVALGDRLKVFGDILLQASFFLVDEPPFDDKAFQKRFDEAGTKLLGQYRDWLATQTRFDAASLEKDTLAWLSERGRELRDVVHVLRVATTGVGAGPGLFDCLEIIGRDSCVRRIDRAIARAKTETK
jgi:glutamyl-tRNA synthetase